MNKPFAVISPSEQASVPSPAPQRARGEGVVGFRVCHGAVRLHRLRQSGAAKIRLPKVARGAPPLAVLINTAGGLTGGDRLAYGANVEEGGRAAVTTQACEKIYRSDGGEAEIATNLDIGAGARLDWLPQETILFNGARLSRRLEVDLGRDAVLLIFEAVLFGRAAHGETMTSGLFRDRWRVRREGRLLFAEDLRFDWADGRLLGRPAVLADAAAMATILCVGRDLESRVERLRDIIGPSGGVSAWNGKLLARIVGESGAALRRVTVPALIDLLDGAALPRLWHI